MNGKNEQICPDKESKKNELIKLASYALTRRDIDSAMDYYLEMLEIDANNAEAWRMFALCQIFNEDYSSAIDSLTNALRLNIDDAMSYFYRGHAFNAEGKYNIAISNINDAIRLWDKHNELYSDDIYLEKSFAYLHLGQYDNSFKNIDTYIKLKPECPRGYYVRAECYRLKNQFNEAINDFNMSLSNEVVWSNISKNAFPLYSNMQAWAFYARGDAYRMIGKYDIAIINADEAIKLDDEYAYAMRGSSYLHLRKADKGFSDFEKSIELDPDYYWVYGERGYWYNQFGKKQDARNDLLKAIELKPDWIWAIEFLENL